MNKITNDKVLKNNILETLIYICGLTEKDMFIYVSCELNVILITKQISTVRINSEKEVMKNNLVYKRRLIIYFPTVIIQICSFQEY